MNVDAYILLLKEAEIEDDQLQSEKEQLLLQMEEMMRKIGEIDQKRMVIATTIGYVKSKVDHPISKKTDVPYHAPTHTVDTIAPISSLRERLKGFFDVHDGVHSPRDLVTALNAEAQAASIRTGINTLYKAGLLGRVAHKGAGYQYGTIKWLKSATLDYKTYQQDRKAKAKAKKQR